VSAYDRQKLLVTGLNSGGYIGSQEKNLYIVHIGGGYVFMNIKTKMPKVKVLATGGTIANKIDEDIGGGVPTLTGEDLIKSIPGVETFTDVHVEQVLNLGSHLLSPDDILEVRNRCRQSFNDGFDGVVVTIGTATMAEYAYMLSITLDSNRPVVLTGAMRNVSLLGTDGSRNLADAIRLAGSSQECDLGVAVCMHGEIFHPHDVNKIHAQKTEAFDSPLGPLGVMLPGRIVMYRKPLMNQYIPVESLTKRVEIIVAEEGGDGSLLEFASEKADGLVLVGFPPGNVSPGMNKAIEKAVAQGVPIVLVHRAIGGVLNEGFHSDGGPEAQLLGAGVLPGGSLTAAKARLKLMVALSYTQDKGELQYLFQNY